VTDGTKNTTIIAQHLLDFSHCQHHHPGQLPQQQDGYSIASIITAHVMKVILLA
jgi:hypothetical protein